MLPKRLCEQVGIKHGDKVAVTVQRGAIILTPMQAVIEGVAGRLSREGSSN